MLEPLLKLGALFVSSIFLALLSLALGIAGATRDAAPDIALKWWSNDARANEHLAQQSLAAGARGLEPARILAREAVQHDAILPGNYSTLAITNADNLHDASAAMAYSESLSRRDLPTQLWLIEAAVRRNDIGGALRHYDIALRTSEQAETMLFPILGQAMDQPAILNNLARVLAAHPLWRTDFLLYAIHNASPAAAANLSDLSARLGAPFGQNFDGLLTSRLADGGEIDRAIRIYRRIGGASKADAFLRNGEFEQESDQTIFDWQLFDNADYWGRRNRADEQSGIRLEFGVNSGGGGRIAQQLLALRPGHYVIRFRSGSAESGQHLAPAIVIICSQGPNQLLLRKPISVATTAGAGTSAVFDVPPASCAAQWLQILVASDQDLLGGAGWIDSISIGAGGSV